MKSLLGRDADEVTFVFVSVDPQRDTPERLAEYVGAFDPAFIGLTGDDAALRPIAQEFGVYYQAVPLEGSETAYTVDHTASSFALDREGRLAIAFSYGTPPDAIVQRIRAALTRIPFPTRRRDKVVMIRFVVLLQSNHVLVIT